MGIGASIVNHDFFESYLGMRVETIDMTEFVRRMDEGIFDPAEFAEAIKWTKKYCIPGEDRNSPKLQLSAEEKEKNWEFVVKMAMIARDLMIGNPKLDEMGFGEEALGHNAIAAGFQGQRHWSDHFPNPDFMEAILNSSFDWNGIRLPFIFATENDSLNAASMLLGHLLTNTPQIFADVRTYWSPKAVKRITGYELQGCAENGMIHLLNSGSAALDGTGQMTDEAGNPTIKPWWQIKSGEVEACLNAVTWFPGNREYFRGGGFSSGFLSRGGMPITICRLNLVKGLGPVLQIAEGYTIDLPKEVHNTLNERTDPTWPSTWFAPRLTGKGAFADVYSVMNNWGANHCAFSIGHIGADLITLASMLRIPVNMHNVPPEKIFRPSAWASFGMDDLQGADYRACKNFGPLY